MKKVLILNYYWPPSGGSGVQRWVRFAANLQEHGFLTTIITTHNGDYPSVDVSLLDAVPDNVKVIRTKTPVFGKFFKKLTGSKTDIPYGSLEISENDGLMKRILVFIRLNLVIPDTRRIWNKYALKAAQQELVTDRYDCIITSGPPHSTHLVGYKLQKELKVKWLADFRDPWTKMGYLKNVKRSKFAELIDKYYENKIVENCDILISATKLIKKDFGNLDKIKIIRNGYIESNFEHKPAKHKGNEFTINFFGTMPVESNPVYVLLAVYHLRETGIENIKMNFYGNICNEIKEELTKIDTDNLVTFHPYIPHAEMLGKMIESSMLLLVINNVKNNEGIITGKIFEYLGSRRPIVALGPLSGEAAEILNETQSGKIFDYKDIEGISKFIRNNINDDFAPTEDSKKYSAKVLTRRLAEVMKGM
jgi:glycosyltransferase involved in cell wall biosynthesis